MRGRIPILVFLVALFLLVGGLTFAVDLYFDWLWFVELGKSVIFTTTLYAKSTVGAVTLAVTFVFLYLNLWHANRGPGTDPDRDPDADGADTAYTFRRKQIRKVAGLLSLLVGPVHGGARGRQLGAFLALAAPGAFRNVRTRYLAGTSRFIFSRCPCWGKCVRFGMLLSSSRRPARSLCTISKASWLRAGSAVSAGAAALRCTSRSWRRCFFSCLRLTPTWTVSNPVRQPRLFGANYADLHAPLPMLTVLAVAALIGALLWIFNAFASEKPCGARRRGPVFRGPVWRQPLSRPSSRNSSFRPTSSTRKARRSSTTSMRRCRPMASKCARSETCRATRR